MRQQRIEFKNVLCPSDFSTFSQRALAHAAAIARWYDAGLTVLHVTPLAPAALTLPAYIEPAALEAVSRKRLLDDLAESAAPVSEGLRVSFELRQGSTAGEILDAARSLPADLLVLGTHGRGGFERLVLGSVAEKVLRKSECPVLTVPRPVEEPPAQEALFRRIVCGVDFSPNSLEALAHALSLAEEADARLTALHVLESLPEDDSVEQRRFDIIEYRDVLEREALARLRQAVPAEARDWCTVDEAVLAGKPHRRIVECARERHADLIVLGTQGRGAVERWLFGATAPHVVREAACPVLTVRAR